MVFKKEIPVYADVPYLKIFPLHGGMVKGSTHENPL